MTRNRLVLLRDNSSSKPLERISVSGSVARKAQESRQVSSSSITASSNGSRPQATRASSSMRLATTTRRRRSALDFNKEQVANGFIGVLLPSFSAAYARACRELGLTEMSQADAARRGHSSLWAAVAAMQPGVMDAFRTMHGEMWSKVGSAQMVAFTVHQVLHGWDRLSPTRTMWARSFWDNAGNEAERRERAAQETALLLAVHDEVRVESIVEAQPLEIVEWVRRAVGSGQNTQGGGGIDRQFATYEARLSAEGPPVVFGEPVDFGFDDFRRLASVADGAWDYVTTRDSGEYVVEQETETQERPPTGYLRCPARTAVGHSHTGLVGTAPLHTSWC